MSLGVGEGREGGRDKYVKREGKSINKNRSSQYLNNKIRCTVSHQQI